MMDALVEGLLHLLRAILTVTLRPAGSRDSADPIRGLRHDSDGIHCVRRKDRARGTRVEENAVEVELLVPIAKRGREVGESALQPQLHAAPRMPSQRSSSISRSSRSVLTT